MKNVYLISAHAEKIVPYNKENTIGSLIKEHIPIEASVGDYVEDLEAYHNQKEEELPKDKCLEELDIKEGDKIIFSRCKQIEVSVNYAGKEYRHKYRPNQKVVKVKENAVKHFGISESDASALLLYPVGSDVNLTDGQFLAAVVKYPVCCVELNLSPDKSVQG
jgi:hypothetical protein